MKQKQHLSKIAELRETKQLQKYSLQQKEVLLSEIADVKRKIGNVKVRIGDAENLKASKEKILTEKLDILHSKIVQYNRSLMDYYCFLDNEMPQKMILEETNLRRESLLAEIQQINALQSKIKENIKEVMKVAEKNIKKSANEIRRLEDAITNEMKQKKLSVLEKDRKQDQLIHLSNKKDKILKDFEEKEAKYISDMQDELKLIETQKENIAALEKAELNLKLDLLGMGKNSVKFFEEWAKQAHEEMLEREEIVKKINREDAALMENLQELLDYINAHIDTFLKK
ncbi:unnamed protein product [Phyllotreta striolata]|uniref:Uncharacterized protein n=1 Tax=Phyllotreta striolata TaxID=444603 RepID=A0A9N9TEU2_PHYSR|nr:unnamed protein product [Phyllotreta striolata]